MKRLLLTITLAAMAAGVSAETVRTRLADWEFSRDGKAWTAVKVPHDWAIGGPFDKAIDMQTVAIVQNGEKKASEKTGRTGSLPWIGRGEYRTTVEIPAGTGYAALVFDGAMSEPEVFFDGRKVGEWKNGYNAFKVELPVAAGRHEVSVKLNNREQSSRWYPGAGLIRPVELVLGGKAGVAIWGNAIHTPDLRTVKVTTETRGACGRIVHRILDDGRAVVEGTDGTLRADFKPWSPEDPKLYTLVTEVYAPDGTLADRTRERFGVRTLEYGKGYFALNGVKRKFKGVCLHHDLGPLGAAFDGDAFRRQLTLLKEMGCDSLRTSHNMPGEEQLAICDEMGVMVMAESFDAWQMPKVKNGYNIFFDDWWRRDLENLVRKCRNHPSVVMWSIGNEVPDQGYASGKELTVEMQKLVHAFDPDPARRVTQGASDMPAAIKSGVTSVMEIPAVTYRLKFYTDIWKSSDTGLMLGAETASTISSRGEYFFPTGDASRPAPHNGRKDGSPHHDNLQCTGYDLDYCSWSNLPDDDWAVQEDNPWTIGEFVWTGFDYLGEPTPYDNFWPSRSSYFGIFDLAGLPKDRYWLYRSHWNTQTHTCHLLPHWTWPGREGQVTPVYCYTDCDRAELFVNGKSQGVRAKDKSSRLDRFRLRWNEVVYEPGEIRVVAFGADGRVVATDSVKTAGPAVSVRTETRRFGNLVFATATLVDAKGTPVPNDDRTLKVKTTGGLRFRGVCNGDATSLEPFTRPEMRTFHGQLVAVAAGASGAVEFEMIDTIRCDGDYRYHLQGVACDGKSLYWSFTDVLVKTDLSGRLVKSVPVAFHSGDLCEKDGVLYVATNLGEFNTEDRAKSFVYAYRADDLSKCGEWAVPELVHGAGGITCANGRFYVIGGLPRNHVKNYVYEYAPDFKFVKRHDLESGYTELGIQTVHHSGGKFYCGCYGATLVSPETLDSVVRSGPDCSVGLIDLHGRLYGASTPKDPVTKRSLGFLKPYPKGK